MVTCIYNENFMILFFLNIIFLSIWLRLQPLLAAIKNDRNTIAMGMLDYIDYKTLKYSFYPGYLTRYGFDWRLVFFETFFRPDQSGPTVDDPRPWVHVYIFSSHSHQEKDQCLLQISKPLMTAFFSDTGRVYEFLNHMQFLAFMWCTVVCWKPRFYRWIWRRNIFAVICDDL